MHTTARFASVRHVCLSVAAILSLSGCASAPVLSAADPDATPAVVQARVVLNRELTRSGLVADPVFLVGPDEVRGINYTDPRSGDGRAILLVTTLPDTITVSYVPSPNAYTEAAWKVAYTDYQTQQPYFWLWSGWSQADAQGIADALRVLVLDARRDVNQRFAERYQKFLVTCQAWIGAAFSVPLPEEAREHKVLAEDAVQRNDLDKAMDEYAAGLKFAPCWADGYYQDAEMEGQTRWYAIAVQEMRKYLQLVPAAPNAQSLRDQILVWNDRMGGN